jgi:hypothetical protein
MAKEKDVKRGARIGGAMELSDADLDAVVGGMEVGPLSSANPIVKGPKGPKTLPPETDPGTTGGSGSSTPGSVKF